MMDLLHAGQHALFVGVIAGRFQRHMAADEENAQVMHVEHGQPIIGARLHLINFGVPRQFASRQFDRLFMYRRGGDNINIASQAKLDRFHHVIQRHFARQRLHFAPDDAVALILLRLQHIDRSPAKARLAGMADFMDGEITVMNFQRPLDNRHGTDQKGMAFIVNAFLHQGGDGDFRADAGRIAQGHCHYRFLFVRHALFLTHY